MSDPMAVAAGAVSAAMVRNEHEPSVYVWVTGGIAYYQESPGVHVTFVDWDNYRAFPSDYSVADIDRKIDEVGNMPTPTAELELLKAEALVALEEIRETAIREEDPHG